MTPEIWELLSPVEQAQFCYAELSAMISAAMREEWRPADEHTLVVSGISTIVGVQ